MLSRRRFNFHLNIILSLMKTVMTWKIHPTRLQLQLAELRITGNTIQNMASRCCQRDWVGRDAVHRVQSMF